jgi:hypothetical protein
MPAISVRTASQTSSPFVRHWRPGFACGGPICPIFWPSPSWFWSIFVQIVGWIYWDYYRDYVLCRHCVRSQMAQGVSQEPLSFFSPPTPSRNTRLPPARRPTQILVCFKSILLNSQICSLCSSVSTSTVYVYLLKYKYTVDVEEQRLQIWVS